MNKRLDALSDKIVGAKAPTVTRVAAKPVANVVAITGRMPAKTYDQMTAGEKSSYTKSFGKPAKSSQVMQQADTLPVAIQVQIFASELLVTCSAFPWYIHLVPSDDCKGLAGSETLLATLSSGSVSDFAALTTELARLDSALSQSRESSGDDSLAALVFTLVSFYRAVHTVIVAEDLTEREVRGGQSMRVFYTLQDEFLARQVKDLT